VHQRHQHQQFDWCEGVSAQQRLYYWRGDASVHWKEVQSRMRGDEEHGKEIQGPIAEAE
jgi:hypothetical protein